MSRLDATHDVANCSWVPSAVEHRIFPIQNLPFGIASVGKQTPWIAMAIGDEVLNLSSVASSGLLRGLPTGAGNALQESSLNALLALDREILRTLRLELYKLLAMGTHHRAAVEGMLVPASNVTLHIPTRVGDYTDFFVGIHHAVNTGRILRPEAPLFPNYKHVPIAYHGRASSIVTSGTPVRRPRGQTRPTGHDTPTFGPCARLDYELELGLWIAEGNALGEPVSIEEAERKIAGLTLLNDWSARDIQFWEAQPLGPFLAKNFMTTVSPWVVTLEALEPFRKPQPARPAGDPQPLPYLSSSTDARRGAFDIQLEVHLTTPEMRRQGSKPAMLANSNAMHMYWTAAQLVSHHTSNGCNLQSGDLIGTGTLSGPDRQSCGALLESTRGGTEPIRLPTGETRTFLEDGDEVIFTGSCAADGFASIGFGECRGLVVPAS